MSQINNIYVHKVAKPSDINEHLPVLKELATGCNAVAEFGVREVVSTFAFASARPKKIYAVDIVKHPNVDVFLQLCEKENIDIQFFTDSTLTFTLPEPVDLLFIDTLHTYDQLKAELTRHCDSVRKYIALHDTITFGTKNEMDIVSTPAGLQPAVREFLQEHTEWREHCTYTNNNGLTILERLK